MKNYVQPGENLTVAAPYDVASGAGALVGAIFGVAQETVLSGADVVLVRRGVFDLAKLEAQAWTVGQKIFWDNSNKECTTVADGNTFVGFAVEVASNPSTSGRVLLPGTGEAFAQAAFVADASSGSAAEINALRDALVTAGLMAAS